MGKTITILRLRWNEVKANAIFISITLTDANIVHIVEPQWNPTKEEQAIARAVRIGQTRTVTVFKYITERSVEEVSASLILLQQVVDSNSL